MLGQGSSLVFHTFLIMEKVYIPKQIRNSKRRYYMSTRSEIRFYNNQKLLGCVYHHSDGYPSHIVNDLEVVGGKNPKALLHTLSIAHGSSHSKCAYGDKSEKHQGDIEYSYKAFYEKERKTPGGFIINPKLKKLEITHHPFEGSPKKIFSGEIDDAYKQFVCAKEAQR